MSMPKQIITFFQLNLDFNNRILWSDFSTVLVLFWCSKPVNTTLHNYLVVRGPKVPTRHTNLLILCWFHATWLEKVDWGGEQSKLPDIWGVTHTLPHWLSQFHHISCLKDLRSSSRKWGHAWGWLHIVEWDKKWLVTWHVIYGLKGYYMQIMII